MTSHHVNVIRNTKDSRLCEFSRVNTSLDFERRRLLQ